MFIKRVSIESFKSYKELQMDQELHPGCNLILGLNGCGKSNFLQAIIFALSDTFSKKTKQEKRQLLHVSFSTLKSLQDSQSLKSQVKTDVKDTNLFAIEVVLDNSKQKIPIQQPELTIRKTYNCSTDREDYYLNGKHIAEKELFNLFESGGFSLSASSQFQIVQQGEVEKLALQGEEGFLKMLKQVTGTNVFDERLIKMGDILESCQKKKVELKEILEKIQKRIDELAGDLEEYREIQKIEQEKKALEMVLHTNRIIASNEELEGLRNEKRVLIDQRGKMIDQRDAHSQEDNQMKTQIDDLKLQIDMIEAKLVTLQRLKSELMQNKVEVIDLEFDNDDKLKIDNSFGDDQLRQIAQGISDLKQELKGLDQAKVKLVKELEQIANKSGEVQREKDILLMRKETSEMFKNPAQRKKYYQGELGKIQVRLAEVQKEKSDFEKTIQQSMGKQQEIQDKIQEKEQEVVKVKARMGEAQREIEKQKQEKKSLAQEMKMVIVENTEIEHELKTLKNKQNAEIDQIEKIEPIYSTLKRLKQLVQDRNLECYKGILLDFIECAPQFQPCIDLAAKSKLFSIIVEDLKEAQDLLELNKEIKGGVINIFPLTLIEQMDVKQRTFPQRNDYEPLINRIALKEGADQRLQKLLHNTFSKILLVKNYQCGMEIAKENSFTCITSDLQIIYAGGFLTKVGQYSKSAQNRVSIYKKINQYDLQIQEKLQKKQHIDLQQEIFNEKELVILRNLQKADILLTNLRQAFQQINTMQFEMKSQHENKVEQLNEAKSMVQYYGRQELELSTLIQKLEKEKDEKQVHKFTEEDSTRLLNLNRTLDELSQRENKQKDEMRQISQRSETIQTMLNDKYLKKQNELQMMMIDQEVDESMTLNKSIDLDQKQKQLEIDQIEQQMEQLKNQHHQLQEKLFQQLDQEGQSQENDDLVKRLKQKTQEIEMINAKMDELQFSIKKVKETIQKITIFDHELFIQKKNDPNMNQMALAQEITERVKELDKYPKKNKYCVQKFDEYYESNINLQKKFSEQEETEAGILKLLVDLDIQKQVAIERNFKKLNLNFQEIFARIVPNGKSELKLIKNNMNEESQISHPSQFQDSSQILRLGEQLYRGIKVKVSFSGESSLEGLGHLSGGQKAVVAVSLLFSILKIEAAPYYILDEFDNALDAEFRGAIAALVFELSKQSQFMITTFRQELIEGADRIFEIGFVNRVSKMKEVGKERAFELIQEMNQPDQAQ